MRGGTHCDADGAKNSCGAAFEGLVAFAAALELILPAAFDRTLRALWRFGLLLDCHPSFFIRRIFSQ